MKRKIDTVLGRWIYGDGSHSGAGVPEHLEQGHAPLYVAREGQGGMQWKLFTLGHNIEKIGNYAAA
jgi:hypothetical protein